VDDDDSFDLAASGLRLDGAELATSVEVLASKLEQALPAMTRVERGGGGLLGRGAKRVRAVRVQLGEMSYLLGVEGARVQGSRERQVGGICIKRETLSPEQWVEALTEDLKTEAERSADARSALQRLLS
jgi:hypothetical protein